MSARDELIARLDELSARLPDGAHGSDEGAAWVRQWIAESSDDELDGWRMHRKYDGYRLIRSARSDGEWTDDVVDVATGQPAELWFRRIIARDRDFITLVVEVALAPPHELIECTAERKIDR